MEGPSVTGPAKKQVRLASAWRSGGHPSHTLKRVASDSAILRQLERHPKSVTKKQPLSRTSAKPCGGRSATTKHAFQGFGASPSSTPSSPSTPLLGASRRTHRDTPQAAATSTWASTSPSRSSGTPTPLLRRKVPASFRLRTSKVQASAWDGKRAAGELNAESATGSAAATPLSSVKRMQRALRVIRGHLRGVVQDVLRTQLVGSEKYLGCFEGAEMVNLMQRRFGMLLSSSECLYIGSLLLRRRMLRQVPVRVRGWDMVGSGDEPAAGSPSTKKLTTQATMEGWYQICDTTGDEDPEEPVPMNQLGESLSVVLCVLRDRVGLTDDERIRYHPKGSDKSSSIAAGTPAGILKRICSPDKFLPAEWDTIFITWSTFTSAFNLFAVLSNLYMERPPAAFTERECEVWMARIMVKRRAHIFLFIKTWLARHSSVLFHPEWSEALTLWLVRLGSVPNDTCTSDVRELRDLVATIKDKRRETVGKLSYKHTLEVRAWNQPSSEYTRMLDEIDEEDLAAEITLTFHELFTSIDLTELLNTNWTSKHKHNLAPHVLGLVDFSNYITQWTITQVLTRVKSTDRVAVVEKLVRVTTLCLDMNNFGGAFALAGALLSSSLRRLRATIQALKPEASELLESLERLLSSSNNYNEYRSRLAVAPIPTVPYLGITLHDIIFLEQAMKDTTKDGLVNWDKRMALSKVLYSFTQMQRGDYQVRYGGHRDGPPRRVFSIPAVRTWLLSCKVLSDTEVQALSATLEPKNAEDAIGNLLHQQDMLQAQVDQLQATAVQLREQLQERDDANAALAEENARLKRMLARMVRSRK